MCEAPSKGLNRSLGEGSGGDSGWFLAISLSAAFSRSTWANVEFYCRQLCAIFSTLIGFGQLQNAASQGHSFSVKGVQVIIFHLRSQGIKFVK